jgi:hypothetical protein
MKASGYPAVSGCASASCWRAYHLSWHKFHVWLGLCAGLIGFCAGRWSGAQDDLFGPVQVVEAVVDEDVDVGLDPFGRGPGLADILLRHVARETGLARRACSLLPEQSEQLARLNEAWIKEKIAEKQKPAEQDGNAVLRGIGRFLGGGGNVIMQGGDEDDRQGFKQLRTKIDAEINSILNEEQRAVLAEEKLAREEFRREATAAVMVASLDRQVYLSAKQRDELNSAVVKWIGNKQLYWMFYLSNNAYVPDLPRSVLIKALDDTQVKAINSLQRYNYEMEEYFLETNGLQSVRFKD